MKPQVDGSEPDARALMAALIQQDNLAMDVKRQLDSIRISYELETRKLTAVRDLFIEKFKANPYALEPSEFGAGPFSSEGRFAFLRMNPGEAAKQVLMLAEKPMVMDEIIAVLREGGLAVSDTRTINAALMNTGGIRKNKEGRYYYEEEPNEAIFE